MSRLLTANEILELSATNKFTLVDFGKEFSRRLSDLRLSRRTFLYSNSASSPGYYVNAFTPTPDFAPCMKIGDLEDSANAEGCILVNVDFASANILSSYNPSGFLASYSEVG